MDSPARNEDRTPLVTSAPLLGARTNSLHDWCRQLTPFFYLYILRCVNLQHFYTFIS